VSFFLALDENFKRVLGMIPDARNSPRYDSVMGLEDELEARYPVLRRPPGYAEAERLVGETLSLFSEAARVLAKYDVPTETLERRRPKPEGFFKRFVFDERPKPVAEGWRLCQRFGSDALWVDTYGTPWVTTSYSRESDVQNIYANDSYEEVPLDINEWIKTFAEEGEQIFSPCSAKFVKRYDLEGRPEPRPSL
jgi:hypothetical protein